MKRFFESRWFLVVCIFVGALFGTAISQVYEWHIDQKIEKAISSERDAPAQQVELVPAPAPVNEVVDTPELTPAETDALNLKSDWDSEKMTRENPTPMRMRILKVLQDYSYGDGTVGFTSLKFGATAPEWDDETEQEFWRTLQILQHEGKIVRVSGPTGTKDSRWALPPTE